MEQKEKVYFMIIFNIEKFINYKLVTFSRNRQSWTNLYPI